MKTEHIFSINNEKNFNDIALEIFHFQYKGNEIYRQFCDLMKVDLSLIDHFSQIPFLPIELFKSKEVFTFVEEKNRPQLFTSSGTSGQITSKHIVSDVAVYEQSFLKGFELFYGSPKEYCILALLPSYLERSGSSLVYMFQHLIEMTKENGSGFYLHNLNELKEKISALKKSKQKTILLGVTYALLDLAEMNVPLNENFRLMETGGMKGKRKELLKEELHTILKEKFSVNTIHSEYGMTELLSQAYSKGNGIFECPPWLKILVRDPYDPTQLLPANKTGALNVIDLANINSCSFIATSDLGKVSENNSFEILGRIDDAELRGCNLMML
ncbi:MAG: acyl transferase [Bacteroidia bacterium]|nr:acyl transferase [Bacteroidia bacterium]